MKLAISSISYWHHVLAFPRLRIKNEYTCCIQVSTDHFIVKMTPRKTAYSCENFNRIRDKLFVAN